MPYIGSAVNRGIFETTPANQRFNGDGSDTTFTLTTAVANVQSVMVSVDGVVQDTAAYTIPDGTTLTFSAAPSSGTGNIFVQYLGLAHGTVVPPEANKGNFLSGGLFRTNAQSLEEDITITATTNAQVTGTFTIADSVTLTINSGGRLVVS
jgi:hypothetical protein